MKPCPNCGSTDIERGENWVAYCKVHGSHPTGYWFECDDCGLESPIKPTLPEAEAAWDSL